MKCSRCDDDHEDWPDGAGGYLCQMCWEAEADRMWWETGCALEAAGLRPDSIGAFIPIDRRGSLARNSKRWSL